MTRSSAFTPNRRSRSGSKAVLGSRGVEFEYTHDLHRLIAEVTAAVGEFPFDTPEVVALTEHAVPLRYDEILDTEPLDRQGGGPLGRRSRQVGRCSARGLD